MKNSFKKKIAVASFSLATFFAMHAAETNESAPAKRQIDELASPLPAPLSLDGLERVAANQRNSPPYDVCENLGENLGPEMRLRELEERNRSLKLQQTIFLEHCNKSSHEHDDEYHRRQLLLENEALENQNRILAEFCPLLREAARNEFPGDHVDN